MRALKNLSLALAVGCLLVGAECDVLPQKTVAPPPPVPQQVVVESAPVAVLYSPASSKSLGWRWDWEWQGALHSLNALGVDYEVLSPAQLKNWDGKVLILPNLRNMSAQTVEQIKGLDAKILATYMTSYRDENNEPWEANNFALSEQLGVNFRSWVGGEDKAAQLVLGEKLGRGQLSLGRSQAMFVEAADGAEVLAEWPNGEAAIVETKSGMFVGEDLFCPENSDSRPTLELVAKLLNELEPGVAKKPDTSRLSQLPKPESGDVKKSGQEVRVGLGVLEGETLLRASGKLSVNGREGVKFHRWTPGQSLEVSGEPYVEVLRLKENGTYKWSAHRGSLSIGSDGFMVNNLDFEEYLAGVVPSEVPSYFPEESLKAMAVVARTYAKSHLGRHRHYDVCNTVHCQVYSGLGRESSRTNEAVSSTTDQILTFEGHSVNALFHAVCGGTTAASGDAWPGGGGTPYLSSRDDGKYCAHSGRYRWVEDYSREALTEKLATALARRRDYVGCSDVLELAVAERGESGRVTLLSVRTPEKTYYVEGDSIRWLFSGGRISTAGLKSTLFELEATDDGYKVKGGGWGHGVGMCQQGACGRAKAGQNYREILAHYYPRTSLGERAY